MEHSFFPVLANYPGWLERSWRDVRTVAASPAFRRAARRIRMKAADLTAGEREIENLPPLLAIEAEARALTETSIEVLPKLMLVATAFQHSGPCAVPVARRAGSVIRARDFAVRRGSAPSALGIPLVDPHDATGRLSAVLEDVRQRHGHPVVPPYYRGLANWAALLVRLWAVVRPVVGTERYRGWRHELIAAAEREWASLSPDAPAASDGGGDPSAIVTVFRTATLPDLLLDVTMLARVVDADAAVERLGHWRRNGTFSRSSGDRHESYAR
jgi:hypothetical protein